MSAALDASTPAPLRLGLIGYGRIGRPLVDTWAAGGLPGWSIDAILVRGAPDRSQVPLLDAVDDFFARRFDLIVEAAGPAALAAHGGRALGCCDVWTVSAAALADPALYRTLARIGAAAGHRLRVVSGAIAGLDGVATVASDPDARLELDIDLPPHGRDGQVDAAGPADLTGSIADAARDDLVFDGTARAAAARFPESVNVAAAAALAGPGLDRTRVVVRRPGNADVHRLALTAEGPDGRVGTLFEPRRVAGRHPVASCLIAMLRRERQTIWVG